MDDQDFARNWNCSLLGYYRNRQGLRSILIFDFNFDEMAARLDHKCLLLGLGLLQLCLLHSVHPVIGFLEVGFHPPILSRLLLLKLLTDLYSKQLRHHVPLDPPHQRSLARHVVYPSVVDKKAIKWVVERQRGVESVSN